MHFEEYILTARVSILMCLFIRPLPIHILADNIFLYFVDRASRYIHVMKTNLMHYLSSVYFINQTLHASGIFVAHHQEVYYMYTTRNNCCIYIQYTSWWWATSMPETRGGLL